MSATVDRPAVAARGGMAPAVAAAQRTFWRDALTRLFRRPIPAAGAVILLALTALAVVGPGLSAYTYDAQDLYGANAPPSAEHWFGTDDLGRDMFVRAWTGTRISLVVGVTAALLDILIGTLYGGIAGYFGGRRDELMMRFVDMLYGVPQLLLIILLSVVLQPGLVSIIVALSITGWIGSARLVRGQVLQLREMEYVVAARAVGVRFPRLFLRHLLPNAAGPIIVAVTFSVPHAIFGEATLSFLGLGVPAPLSSLGTMISDGLVTILSGQTWRLLVPAVLLSLLQFAFNAVGDGLRDALDPRTLR